MRDIHPFDWLAHAAVWAGEHGARLLLHISGNVAHLGLGWVLAYWLMVCWLWQVGRWGNAQIRRARVGADFLEFAGGRARWVGWAARVFELQIKLDAWRAIAVLGYPAALLLLALGALGLWTLALVGVWATLKAAELQRARTRRLHR